jgi:alpha-L-arabinofuranosidase
VFVTPTYRAIQLYATNLGAERLEAAVQGPTYDLTDGPTKVPFVDVAASRSADGRRYILKLVNTNFDTPARVRVTIDGAKPSGRATQHTLTAPSLNTANGFATPDAVGVTTTEIAAGPQFTVDLPRHAVAVIVLDAAGPP